MILNVFKIWKYFRNIPFIWHLRKKYDISLGNEYVLIEEELKDGETP